ncbi:hypothetical protein WDU94_014093 [Cyamophila willieti]
MCDAQDILYRLKEIVADCEQGKPRRPPSPGQVSMASSSASIPTNEYRPRQECNNNAKLHYNTPVSSDLPPVCPDAGPIPGCHSYEIRCKQTLDGNIAKPTILCAEGQMKTLYPPMYFGNTTGSYRPMPGRQEINLDFDLDLLSCGCHNGFCPPSRYEQFMAGKGGLPIGHPDANRPEKFHHSFGMGVTSPTGRDLRNRGN